MKMWSKGLGRTELALDFTKCKIAKDPNSENLIIYGNVAEPVDWEFKITVAPEDFPSMIKLMINFPVIKQFLKHIIKTTLALVGIGADKGGPEDGLVEKVNQTYEQIMNPTTRKRPKIRRVA